MLRESSFHNGQQKCYVTFYNFNKEGTQAWKSSTGSHYFMGVLCLDAVAVQPSEVDTVRNWTMDGLGGGGGWG